MTILIRSFWFKFHPPSIQMGEFYKTYDDKIIKYNYLINFQILFRKLEFDIAPTGCFLQLSASKLSFCIDVPEAFVPQNFFASKLFEFVEVRVNHVTVSMKSSDNDYFLTDYFNTLTNFDGLMLQTTGSLECFFDNDNVDASMFIGNKEKIQSRRKYANLIIDADGNKSYRYHIIMKLNIGLAMASKPLPKEVPLKLIFYRSAPEKALLRALDDDHNVKLTLINPLLEASFIESEYFDKKLALRKIPRLRFPYLERTIRRELLMDGIDQFKIKLAEGKQIFVRNQFKIINTFQDRFLLP